MEQGSDAGPNQMKGRSLAHWRFLCETEEETFEHLLVHFRQVRLVWEIILEIFSISGYSPSQSIRPFFWQGAWVGKKVWPLCLFWTVWCQRNRVAFENKGYRMKNSFICNLWLCLMCIVRK